MVSSVPPKEKDKTPSGLNVSMSSGTSCASAIRLCNTKYELVWPTLEVGFDHGNVCS